MEEPATLFAVIGVEFEEDFGKGIATDRKGRCGLLSWHEDLQKAFIACTKINVSGGFASIKRTGSELNDEIISVILEALL